MKFIYCIIYIYISLGTLPTYPLPPQHSASVRRREFWQTSWIWTLVIDRQLGPFWWNIPKISLSIWFVSNQTKVIKISSYQFSKHGQSVPPSDKLSPKNRPSISEVHIRKVICLQGCLKKIRAMIQKKELNEYFSECVIEPSLVLEASIAFRSV